MVRRICGRLCCVAGCLNSGAWPGWRRPAGLRQSAVASERSFKIDGDDGGMGGGFTGTHRMAGTAWGHSGTRAPF